MTTHDPETSGDPRRDPAPGTTAPEPAEAPAVEETAPAPAPAPDPAEPESRPGDIAPGTEAPEPDAAPEVEDLATAAPDAEAPVAAEAPPAGGAADGAGEPDYRDLYLRAVAETENVRKRARRDVAAAEARGLARFARELLPALDNFDRALAAAEAQEADAEHHLTKGIRLVQQDLVAALARLGIESYSPKGELFDPHHHDAVAQQPVDGVESGTIVEVYQPGYRYGSDVLRAAKVVVAA
jgi:molecular chaperone GrpE